jgi:peptide/nickel transport system substrate-binding protein
MVTRTRKSLLMGAAFVAAGLVLAVDDAAAQKRGGALVYANVSAVGTMDPYVVSAAVVDLEAIHHVYEALIEMGETYNAVPGLAAKVEVSADARTFTFTLRKGVKFSNGKEMTSADVLASFERYKRVSPNAVALADAASMETPDPYTFIVTLNKPNAFFVEILKTPTYPFSIIPAELKDKPGRELDIVGTGPYQVAEYLKDDHLTLRRNDGYVADETARGRTVMPASGRPGSTPSDTTPFPKPMPASPRCNRAARTSSPRFRPISPSASKGGPDFRC